MAYEFRRLLKPRFALAGDLQALRGDPIPIPAPEKGIERRVMCIYFRFLRETMTLSG